MSFVVSTEGFLISSGIHKDYKDHFSITGRRGVHKALNVWLIRLGLIFCYQDSNQYSISDEDFLNNLYIRMCNESDVLLFLKTEPETYLYKLVNLIKQSLQESNPLSFIRSKVSISNDKSKLIFDI